MSPDTAQGAAGLDRSSIPLIRRSLARRTGALTANRDFPAPKAGVAALERSRLTMGLHRGHAEWGDEAATRANLDLGRSKGRVLAALSTAAAGRNLALRSIVAVRARGLAVVADPAAAQPLPGAVRAARGRAAPGGTAGTAGHDSRAASRRGGIS
jgi:hypothetical protein